MNRRSKPLLDPGHFWVQRKMCATCIYLPTSPLDLAHLEAQVADPKLPGFFKGYRTCHHAKQACCRGFWNRHKDKFMLGQIAQRFGLVKFVTDHKRDW